ncbi:GNAT family N-acetyltransferase [Eisenbergiella porci]|mgnify:CR=1 FL=1|uniref:GNAT family N-acetyltransferase n=2 Tax=Lachnospiraceae TaxID=186803 RepID=UPI003A909F90
MADRSIVAEMREFVKGVNRFMLEKVIVSLEKEAAEDKIKELREKLALYQTELLVDTGLCRGKKRADTAENADKADKADKADRTDKTVGAGRIAEGKASGKDAAVYITDRPDAVRAAAGEDACILLYLTEENRGKIWGDIPYAVEGLEGLDGDFLEKVYQRHVKEPWEILQTDRLIVREMTEEDLDALYRIYDQPGIEDVMDGLSEDREEERAYVRAYIERAYPFYGFGLWMLAERESGRCVGRAGFFMREGFDEPELGFIIAREAQRKGYCMEACGAILEYGFRELGFERVQALAAERNGASLAVCRKLGGQRSGSIVWEGRSYVRFVWSR